MTEPWQTAEAAAAEEKKRRERDEWSAQVERERAELPQNPAVQDPKDATVDLSQAPSIRRGLTLDEVTFDWSRWTEEDCEMVLLGWIYRQRHHEGDRRADGADLVEASRTGNYTGVPDSEAKLKARGTRKSGIQTVLETTISPEKFAAQCILRDRDMLSEADGTAGASLWNIKDDRQPWREDEEIVHGELSYRFKKTFLRWKDRGWLILEPVMKWSSDDTSGTGRDGMPSQCRLTYKAIDAAEERIKGTPLAKGPGNPLGTKTQRQRDQVHVHAPWYEREWKGGAKAGT